MTQCALVLLHYQNDVLHPEGRIRVGLTADDPARSDVLNCAKLLLATARERSWTVIHVRVAFRSDFADLPRNMPIMRRVQEIGAVREGEWGAEFLPDFAPSENEREFVVTHQRISAFQGTSLDELLRLQSAARLLVAGVATHSVVEGTVREAADRGYEVVVASDACASADRTLHMASLASMQLIADVVATVDALRITANKEMQ